MSEQFQDGKRTTHAMTSMLVSSAPAESTRIPRLPKATSRTFDRQSLSGLQELFFSVCNLKTYFVICIISISKYNVKPHNLQHL